MKIVKETSRRVVSIPNYNGVCDGCGTPLSYPDELVLIEVINNDEVALLVPVDRLSCPYCSKEVSAIRLWKNLEVSQELLKGKP